MEYEPILCAIWRSPPWEPVYAYSWKHRLVGMTLGEQSAERLSDKLRRTAGQPVVMTDSFPEALRQELEEYFRGERREFTIPLTLLGTTFQTRVWQALRQVPYGSTVRYGQLAQMAGVAGCRAVGSAMAANPICILVPCHRVLPAAGGVGNYSAGGGASTKRALLALEGIQLGGGTL